MSSRHARQMRQYPTDAERALWRQLRSKQLQGARFRRQQPIGPYIADFFCPEQLLVIEVDGGQHAIAEAKDAVRTEWLHRSGYRVLRFWNNDVLRNMEGVLEAIRAALRA
jgi:very-short-patch-repair endonuclease